MGYWCLIFLVVVAEDQTIFRRQRHACIIVAGLEENGGFDWTAWDDWKGQPLVIAAFSIFLLGWAGANFGMGQVYYQGPVAFMVGDYGADLGAWTAIGSSCFAYAPLRILELNFFQN